MGRGCQKGKSRYYEILHFVQDDRGEEGEDDRGEKARMTEGEKARMTEGEKAGRTEGGKERLRGAQKIFLCGIVG